MMTQLEKHFQFFRDNIVGNEHTFRSPYGLKKIRYMDWAASGRLYRPIEEKILHQFGPFVANTHTETNVTGKTMTLAYEEAKKIIKDHVNADENDLLFFEGTGMTGAVCKIQRLLGLCLHEKYKDKIDLTESMKPVVFITHMEHHSNQVSWEESIADVVIVPPGRDGKVSPRMLEKMLEKYKERSLKIGAFTACSNVTGIETPYHKLAEVMHRFGGICFVDFSASAPYVKMNMHPEESLQYLDGIFFSPHKFLGGPGTTGVAIVSEALLTNKIPDRPGGGTVKWTNPWGEKSYLSNIEEKEDGGTPGFLQAFRTALSVRLKEEMGIQNMKEQDQRLVQLLFDQLKKNSKIVILEEDKIDRLPIVSFYTEGISYQLIVKLLNDVHGIQVRGGCSCAGTYGHYMLGIGQDHSKSITNEIDNGIQINKPGWVRISLHPTMTEQEVLAIGEKICDIVDQINFYKNDYEYLPACHDFQHKNEMKLLNDDWFNLQEDKLSQALTSMI